MAGDKKPRFMSRDPRPRVATPEDFEEVFARQVATRKHIPMDIPVERIQPSPFQIRKTFDDIDELAQSMRLHGFTSRLWVREHPTLPNTYQLVFGERRLRAAKQAGITVIPCDVTQFDDAELREIGLTENLQRRDLQPLEEAEGFRQFMGEFGYSVRTLADRIGKDKMYVQSRLSLLRTPADVREMVAQRPDSVRAALEISKLPTVAQRRPLVEGVISGILSKEAVRGTVRDLLENKTSPANVDPSSHIATGGVRGQANESTGAAGDERRIEQTLARDYRLFQSMLARWQVVQTQGRAEQERVITYVEQVLEDVRRLMDVLEQPSDR